VVNFDATVALLLLYLYQQLGQSNETK